MANLSQLNRLLEDLEKRGRNQKAILAMTGIKRSDLSNAIQGYSEKQVDICYDKIKAVFADELSKPPAEEPPTNTEMLMKALRMLEDIAASIDELKRSTLKP